MTRVRLQMNMLLPSYTMYGITNTLFSKSSNAKMLTWGEKQLMPRVYKNLIYVHTKFFFQKKYQV